MNPYPPIALCGLARSGKNSVADVLTKHYGYTQIAFAEPLREMALVLNPYLTVEDHHGHVRYVRYADLFETYGYDRAKAIPAFREFLQRLGTEAGRGVLGENVWVDAAVKKARALDTPVTFTDCRFKNEGDAVKDMGGLLWLITRPGVERPNAHVSENFVSEAKPDAKLYNSGTLAVLEQTVHRLMTLYDLPRVKELVNLSK